MEGEQRSEEGAFDLPMSHREARGEDSGKWMGSALGIEKPWGLVGSNLRAPTLGAFSHA